MDKKKGTTKKGSLKKKKKNTHLCLTALSELHHDHTVQQLTLVKTHSHHPLP